MAKLTKAQAASEEPCTCFPKEIDHWTVRVAKCARHAEIWKYLLERERDPLTTEARAWYDAKLAGWQQQRNVAMHRQSGGRPNISGLANKVAARTELPRPASPLKRLQDEYRAAKAALAAEQEREPDFGPEEAG